MNYREAIKQQPYVAHITLSEPMTSRVQQGSSLGSCSTFPSPNPHYNPTFGSFDLVSSPVWLEAETNISNSYTFSTIQIITDAPPCVKKTCGQRGGLS